MIHRLLALLMALAMLLTLGGCDKPTEENAPEQVTQTAEAFIKAYYLRDYVTQFSLCFHDARKQWEDKAINDLGSAQNFFALAQKQADEKGIKVTVDSFDTYYAAYHQFLLADVETTYGEHTLTVTATGCTKMEADQLAQFRNELLAGPAKEYMSTNALKAITEAYTVAVNIAIDGEKKDYNETYFVYMVNHKGKWLVADHSS